VITVPGKILEPVLEAVQAEYGFQINADHLTLPGLCAGCQTST
jgi:Fe2+ or Zn2+ uptake regulation protein